MTPLRPRLIAALLTLPLAAVTLAGCASGQGSPDAAASASSKPVATTATSPATTPTASPLPTATASPTTSAAPAAQLSAAQQRQVDYALTYWKNYNSAVYGNDNPNGGDCANFVSQTLIQRGWKMNGTWYNHGQNQMSGAWAYVPSMLNYFTANAQTLGLVELGDADRAKFAVGDVVMFWWKNANGTYSAGPDHVQVIDRLTTGANGKIKVEMASHNLDYEYRDLDNEITVEHPGAKYVVWHLTKDTNS
ncbi:MAG: amidase domain-containing protein [Microbacteriaceae bacterium]|nr:amidase domain-containing protein [Microbacteriaceae bacterium]MCL2794273.1 amidase domain-containing protein [Microbacteriaceae bacterium]